jgi:hypothetical protein
MWWLAAAAAAPIVANMLMPQPATPQYGQVAPAMSPQQQGYQTQLWQTASNPNSAANAVASANATNQVNTNMARLGLARSSMGINAQQDEQAQIARQFQQQAFGNENSAMGTINASNAQQNQVNEYNMGQQNQSAQAAYNQAMQNRNNTIGMFGTAAKIGAQAYGAGAFNSAPTAGGYDPSVMSNSIYGSGSAPSMGSQFDQPSPYGVGYQSSMGNQYGATPGYGSALGAYQYSQPTSPMGTWGGNLN